MKTKAQKTAQVEGGMKQIEASRTLLFGDFTGTASNDMNALRKSLHGIGTKFEVFRKRLLRVAFEKKGIKIDPEEFKGQVGVAFGKGGIEELAGVVYAFMKQGKNFKMLGGYDTAAAKFYPAAEVMAIGQLPPRDVLLAQVAGTFASPLSTFLYVLGERAKQVK